MKKLLATAALCALFAPAAHAGLMSGDGTETCTLGSASGACHVVTPHPAWSTLGAWIAPAPEGTFVPNAPSWSVTDSYTATTAEQWNLFFLADDTASVTINGVQIISPNFTQGICAVGPLGCEPGEEVWQWVSLGAGETLTLTMEVYNRGLGTEYPSNPTGVSYGASPVPVPTGLLLGATGIAGVAWLARRKRG